MKMKTYNKAINYAPSAPDARTSRRLSRRYMVQLVELLTLAQCRFSGRLSTSISFSSLMIFCRFWQQNNQRILLAALCRLSGVTAAITHGSWTNGADLSSILLISLEFSGLYS